MQTSVQQEFAALFFMTAQSWERPGQTHLGGPTCNGMTQPQKGREADGHILYHEDKL